MPCVRLVPGSFVIFVSIPDMRAAPRQFVIYLITANGKRGEGADDRDDGDGVEDPGLREEVTEQTCREGGDDITRVVIDSLRPIRRSSHLYPTRPRLIPARAG